MATFLFILQLLGALNGIWALIDRIRKKVNEIEDPKERKKAREELRGIYRQYRHRAKTSDGKLMGDLDSLYERQLTNLETRIDQLHANPK